MSQVPKKPKKFKVRRRGRDAGFHGIPREACSYKKRTKDGRRNWWYEEWICGWLQGSQWRNRELYEPCPEAESWARVAYREDCEHPYWGWDGRKKTGVRYRRAKVDRDPILG